MKRVISISGGKTSAYLAANYNYDDLIFALVRTSDTLCKFKDEGLRKKVEDKIQMDFVGTLEDDLIIRTLFDLEQYLGTSINWVSGLTFDEVVKEKGNWLPSKMRRYCTRWMKIDPIFQWWKEKYLYEPVEMEIGFRYNERNRKAKIIDKCDINGMQSYNTPIGTWTSGRHKGKNRFGDVIWRKPVFSLIDDQILKDNIISFWEDKSVLFAERNNCVGCFHRSTVLLNQISISEPEKFEWFAKQEGGKKGTWKKDISYSDISKLHTQLNLFSKTSNCNSGFCEV